jgi:hypothetical protein
VIFFLNFCLLKNIKSNKKKERKKKIEMDTKILSTSELLETDHFWKFEYCASTLCSFIGYYEFLAFKGIITKEESDSKKTAIEDFLETVPAKTLEKKTKQFHQEQIAYIKSLFEKITEGKVKPGTVFWEWFKKCEPCVYQAGIGHKKVGLTFTYTIRFYQTQTRSGYRKTSIEDSPHHACLPPERKEDLFPTLLIHMAAIITGQKYSLSDKVEVHVWRG